VNNGSCEFKATAMAPFNPNPEAGLDGISSFVYPVSMLGRYRTYLDTWNFELTSFDRCLWYSAARRIYSLNR